MKWPKKRWGPFGAGARMGSLIDPLLNCMSGVRYAWVGSMLKQQTWSSVQNAIAGYITIAVAYRRWTV